MTPAAPKSEEPVAEASIGQVPTLDLERHIGKLRDVARRARTVATWIQGERKTIAESVDTELTQMADDLSAFLDTLHPQD